MDRLLPTRPAFAARPASRAGAIFRSVTSACLGALFGALLDALFDGDAS